MIRSKWWHSRAISGVLPEMNLAVIDTASINLKIFVVKVVFVYRKVIWLFLSEFPSTYCPCESRFIPVSHQCHTRHPSVQGNEILLVLPKVYISFFFMSSK